MKEVEEDVQLKVTVDDLTVVLNGTVEGTVESLEPDNPQELAVFWDERTQKFFSFLEDSLDETTFIQYKSTLDNQALEEALVHLQAARADYLYDTYLDNLDE